MLKLSKFLFESSTFHTINVLKFQILFCFTDKMLSSGHNGEHSCDIILNLDQWFRCHLKKSLRTVHSTRGKRKLTTIAHIEPLAGELK